MKLRVVLYDVSELSPYYRALVKHSEIRSVTLVSTKSELFQVLRAKHKSIDLVIVDLLLSPQGVVPHSQRTLVNFDGMSVIEQIRRRWSRLQIAVLTPFAHESNVLWAYRTGVCWFEHKQYTAIPRFIKHLISASAGLPVIPDGLSVQTTNRIRFYQDEYLCETSETDQDMLMLMLRGLSNEEIVAEFGWATKQSLYNRVSLILARGGFDTRDALLEHCRGLLLILPVN